MANKRLEAPADVQDVQPKSSGVAPDVLAGLDALAAEASQAEQAGQAEQARAAEAADQTETDHLAADLVGLLDMVAVPARPGMWWLSEEQFTALWGPNVRRGIAEPAAAIMKRHGWTFGTLVAEWGPYAALLAAVGPSMAATVGIYKQAKAHQLATQQQGPANVAANQAG